MKLGNSLRATVSVWLFVVLAAALLPFVLLLVKFSREDLQAATSRHVVQIAQMVVKSTRLAMLHDDRAAVTQIISDLSLQPGIERLRLIDAEGEIIDSNHTREVGYSVDKREEPCLHCHSGDKPQEHVPLEKRWRIIDEPRGQRAMIAMEIIRNEPSCTSASCHEHKADQKVLGVVDITYSLADVDRSVTRHTATIGGLWLVGCVISGQLPRLALVSLAPLGFSAAALAVLWRGAMRPSALAPAIKLTILAAVAHGLLLCLALLPG